MEESQKSLCNPPPDVAFMWDKIFLSGVIGPIISSGIYTHAIYVIFSTFQKRYLDWWHLTENEGNIKGGKGNGKDKNGGKGGSPKFFSFADIFLLQKLHSKVRFFWSYALLNTYS